MVKPASKKTIRLKQLGLIIMSQNFLPDKFLCALSTMLAKYKDYRLRMLAKIAFFFQKYRTLGWLAGAFIKLKTTILRKA